MSDPVGAIGIQADLATFASFGCHGLSVTTGLLISDTARVEDVQAVDPDWVSDQARVLLEDMSVAAIKIGALGSVENVTAIAEIVSDYPDVPLILDPFVSALPEQGMDDEDILTAVRQLLIPQTTLLVLSPVELERLAETWRDSDPSDTLQNDVDYLVALGCEYVLVTCMPADAGKGGSGDGKLRANTLFGEDGVVRHDVWRHLPGIFNGAGSTLSAAATALLALDQGGGGGDIDSDVQQAVVAAQEYTAGALKHARRFGMGKLVPNRLFRAGA
nr:hydroxymethylpyrimidine/phosphomethylpyrimidine kinase [Janthinobacterium psychrotolerans]